MFRVMSITSLISPRAELASRSRNAARRWRKLITIGFRAWRREKASSCRVSVSPRAAASSIASIERRSFGSRSRLLQHLRVAADDHEHVVEVMRYAAGQLAQRLHLLRLGELLLGALQLRLGFAPFGDVARDIREPDELAFLVADGVDHDAGKKQGPSLRTRQPSPSRFPRLRRVARARSGTPAARSAAV